MNQPNQLESATVKVSVKGRSIRKGNECVSSWRILGGVSGTMARLTIALVSLSLVVANGNPAPSETPAVLPNHDSKGKSQVSQMEVTCLNSQVQPDANGHFYFVPNLARAGSECNNTASKFEEQTLQIQARQLCLLTDFYLEQICHNRNLTVTLGDPKSDPCTTTTTASLPQLARRALQKDLGLSDVKRSTSF